MTQPAQNTIARFGMAIDDHDLEAVMALFCDDATLEVDGRPGSQKGKQEIRALFEGVISLGWQGQHTAGLSVLDGTDDELEFVAPYSYLRFEDGFHFQTVGRYEGRLRRNGDQWQFARLAVRVRARN